MSCIVSCHPLGRAWPLTNTVLDGYLREDRD
jgi:hypothetical protein